MVQSQLHQVRLPPGAVGRVCLVTIEFNFDFEENHVIHIRDDAHDWITITSGLLVASFDWVCLCGIFNQSKYCNDVNIGFVKNDVIY